MKNKTKNMMHTVFVNYGGGFLQKWDVGFMQLHRSECEDVRVSKGKPAVSNCTKQKSSPLEQTNNRVWSFHRQLIRAEIFPLV